MKQWIFRLLGKGPEAVVVTFCSGDRRVVPPHGGGGARRWFPTGATSSPPWRTGRNCDAS